MAPGDGALENGALGDGGWSHSRDGPIGDGSMWVAILGHST